MPRPTETAELMLAIGLLAVACWCVRGSHRRRQAARSPALPVKLQTWEGEGGRPEP